MNLIDRIAATLGWTVSEANGFSLASLRELVRPRDPKLAQEISRVLQTGRHIRDVK